MGYSQNLGQKGDIWGTQNIWAKKIASLKKIDQRKNDMTHDTRYGWDNLPILPIDQNYVKLISGDE